jgi:hypothetical protein
MVGVLNWGGFRTEENQKVAKISSQDKTGSQAGKDHRCPSMVGPYSANGLEV